MTKHQRPHQRAGQPDEPRPRAVESGHSHRGSRQLPRDGARWHTHRRGALPQPPQHAGRSTRAIAAGLRLPQKYRPRQVAAAHGRRNLPRQRRSISRTSSARATAITLSSRTSHPLETPGLARGAGRRYPAGKATALRCRRDCGDLPRRTAVHPPICRCSRSAATSGSRFSADAENLTLHLTSLTEAYQTAKTSAARKLLPPVRRQLPVHIEFYATSVLYRTRVRDDGIHVVANEGFIGAPRVDRQGARLHSAVRKKGAQTAQVKAYAQEDAFEEVRCRAGTHHRRTFDQHARPALRSGGRLRPGQRRLLRRRAAAPAPDVEPDADASQVRPLPDRRRTR